MDSHVNVAKTLSGLVQPNQLQALARGSGFGEAVQKFEAFFIQSMLKSMRSASLATGLLDSDQSNLFRDWHDQQLADDLASKETFAVAKLLRRQFDADTNSAAPEQINLKVDPVFQRSEFASDKVLPSEQPLRTASIAPLSGNDIYPENTNLKQLVTKQIKEITRASNNTEPSRPEQFVQEIYPHAQQAASKLNTSADVIIAIAALETGWGLHTPKAKNGQDSFNYFGIKANNWQGQNVTNLTKEFDGKNMVTLEDKFRAYENAVDSFNDFADFLLANPRYQDAIQNSSNSEKFASELQNAGYATDPNYAKKIHSILNGSILKNAMHALTASQQNAEVVSAYESNRAH